MGRYHNKCWLDTSISIRDELWNKFHISKLILEVFPEFDFYGITTITKKQWDIIVEKSQTDEYACREIIAEAILWAEKCYKTNDAFTILGI